MFSPISPKATAGKAASSPFALSQTRKAPVKSIPFFEDEIASTAAAARNGKISSRQNLGTAKNSAVIPPALGKSQKLAVNPSLVAKAATKTASAPLLNKVASANVVSVKANTVKAAEGGDAVTTPPVDPAEAVRALLAEFGYDAGSFKFEAHEEYVMFPGGGYTHKFTSVQLPNGTKENFTTDLMSRFPAVTAQELRRLMENQHVTNHVTVQNFNGGV